jgi:hypothetical protein
MSYIFEGWDKKCVGALMNADGAYCAIGWMYKKLSGQEPPIEIFDENGYSTNESEISKAYDFIDESPFAQILARELNKKYNEKWKESHFTIFTTHTKPSIIIFFISDDDVLNLKPQDFLEIEKELGTGGS